MPDKPGIASEVFSALAKQKISVDMIIQSIHGGKVADLSFTVSRADLKKALDVINGELKKLGAKDIVSDSNVIRGSRDKIDIVSKISRNIAIDETQPFRSGTSTI